MRCGGKQFLDDFPSDDFPNDDFPNDDFPSHQGCDIGGPEPSA
jgi:hypothetical protein